MVIVHLGSGRDLKIRGYRCFLRWQSMFSTVTMVSREKNKSKSVFISQSINRRRILFLNFDVYDSEREGLDFMTYKKIIILEIYIVCVFLYTPNHH